MKTRKKSLLSFLIMLMIGMVFLLVATHNQMPPPIHLEPQDGHYQEYNLGPTSKSLIPKLYIASYPFVKVKLSADNYRWIFYGEAIRLHLNRYDDFFLAKKRVAELIEWSTTANTAQSIDISKSPGLTVLRLKNWWNKEDYNLWEKDRHSIFNLWETSLARYVNHMDHHLTQLEKATIDKFDLNAQKIRAKIEIREDQVQILNIINNINTTEAKKLYLEKLATSVFDYLLNKPEIGNIELELSKYRYDFSPIIKDKQYGLFDLLVDPESIPQSNHVSLAIGQSLYNDIRNNNQLSKNYVIGLSPMMVTPNTDNITLDLSNNESIPISQWMTEKDDENKFRYTYSYSIGESQRGLDFLITFTNNSIASSTANLQMDYIFLSPRGQKTDQLISLTIPKSAKKYVFQRFITFAKTTTPLRLSFKLTTSDPVATEQLTKTILTITPIYNPSLTLIKKSNLPGKPSSLAVTKIGQGIFRVNAVNTSQSQDDYIKQTLGFLWLKGKKITTSPFSYYMGITFWPRPMLTTALLLNLILISYLWFKPEQNYLSVSSILKNLSRRLLFLTKLVTSSLGNIFSQFFRKFNLFLLTISLIFLTTDIFYIKEHFDSLIATTIILWMGAVVGLGLAASIHFEVGLLLIIFTFGLNVFQNPAIAEKSAVWTYVFLIAGALHTAIQTPSEANSFPQLLLIPHKLKKSLVAWMGDSIRLFIPFKIILLNSIAVVKAIIYRLFNLHPKTFLDRFLNLIKFIIVLAFCIGLTRVMLDTYIIFKITSRRLSLNPQITRVEPNIAYHSTKIILWGRKFGWPQPDKSRLMTAIGPANTDLWTDSKIIFTIPLHWPTGETKIWVEKSVSVDGKKFTSQSDKITIRLIPRTTHFTPDDDEFFDQLKYLNPETLHINGYKP